MININKGMHNLNSYKIITEKKDYVLRIRPLHFSKELIREDYNFLSYLRANNFPAAKIVPTSNGNKLGLKKDFGFELQEYISHQKDAGDYEYNNIGNQLARFLAEYHKLAFEYDREIIKPSYVSEVKHPITLQAKYFSGALNYGVKKYQHLDAATKEQQQRLDSYVDYFLTKLKIIRTEFNNYPTKIPKVVSHNDFRGNNILFQDNKIVGLIDFDYCATEFYYLDLIELLYCVMIWDNNELRFWGLPQKRKINLVKGKEVIENYFADSMSFDFDLELSIKLLQARVISQVFHPSVDITESIEDKIEVMQRLERIAKNLESLNNCRIIID